MIYSSILYPIKQRVFWLKARARQKHWENIPHDGHGTVLELENGLKMKLQKNDLISCPIYCNVYEWPEREWLNRFLRKGMTVYDIGANIGYYSLIAAGRVGEQGHVIAIEPSQYNFNRMMENIKLNTGFNSIIRPYLIAASNCAEMRNIFTYKEQYFAWDSLANQENGGESYTSEIHTETLDAMYVKERWPNPHFIKIDVEGWETRVLEGAESILTNYKPALLVEFTEKNLRSAGQSITGLQKILRGMRYELMEYDPRHRKLIPVTHWDFEHKNIICIPKNGNFT